MRVYVRNKNGNPLMPCKPAKARHLLRDGKAKVVNRCPFTIKLEWDCEENVQEVTVGIDKGSSVTGFSCVRFAKQRTGAFAGSRLGNGKILMSGEIHHRTDIKDKMDARRANRRNRRNRKWYRPKRFNNRASSRRSGRLPPSIKANVEEVIRVVGQLPLPISHIIVEDVAVDVRRLSNPDVKGSEYQQSNRLDENLRLACLTRDDFTCQKCNKKETLLEAHHIVWTTKGGKDSIYNLITLCESCHDKVHRKGESGKVKIKGGKVVKGMAGFSDKVVQRTMQGKTLMYQELEKIASFETVYGYQTSAYRKSLSLPKTHDIDALCVATLYTGEVILSSAFIDTPVTHHQENFYTIKFRQRQTRRQFHDLPQKGVGRVRYQVNAELEGFRKGDIVRVKGKWIKQINSIYSNGYLAFARVKGEPSAAKPKDCQLLQKGQTMIWEKVV